MGVTCKESSQKRQLILRAISELEETSVTITVAALSCRLPDQISTSSLYYYLARAKKHGYISGDSVRGWKLQAEGRERLKTLTRKALDAPELQDGSRLCL